MFKTYLKHCGAAFVDDEMTDNIEEMFVVELENKNVYVGFKKGLKELKSTHFFELWIGIVIFLNLKVEKIFLSNFGLNRVLILISYLRPNR